MITRVSPAPKARGCLTCYVKTYLDEDVHAPPWIFLLHPSQRCLLLAGKVPTENHPKADWNFLVVYIRTLHFCWGWV